MENSSIAEFEPKLKRLVRLEAIGSPEQEESQSYTLAFFLEFWRFQFDKVKFKIRIFDPCLSIPTTS